VTSAASAISCRSASAPGRPDGRLDQDAARPRDAPENCPHCVRIECGQIAGNRRFVCGLESSRRAYGGRCADRIHPAALDESVGFAGFSNELKAVSWLHESAQGIVLPRFDEHNGRSAKRRAQEAQRKRDGRKTSASHADTLRTRERERVRSKSPVSPLNLPAGITEPDWQAFRDHRAASRKRLTPRAEELALAKLHALTANGYDAKKLLEHAIEAGWMTFYEREECRASGGAARAAAGPCACGEVGTAKVGGTWRCVAHVRGFEVAA
jgi:hypothetical protein